MVEVQNRGARVSVRTWGSDGTRGKANTSNHRKIEDADSLRLDVLYAALPWCI